MWHRSQPLLVRLPSRKPGHAGRGNVGRSSVETGSPLCVRRSLGAIGFQLSAADRVRLVRKRMLSRRVWLALVSLVLTLGSIPGGLDAAEKSFRAGAYVADVTPEKFPISVNGNMRDVQATKAHDPLSARCLVLDDGETG